MALLVGVLKAQNPSTKSILVTGAQKSMLSLWNGSWTLGFGDNDDGFVVWYRVWSRTSQPGGGTLDIFWWGCAAAHPKRGVLGTGTTQKKGGLRHGYNPKKGGLRHGHECKNGVLGTGTSRKRGKKDNLSNWCCTKGGFGSLFINYPYFFLSTWSVGGGLLWQTKKNRGLRHGSGQKRGVSGMGQARKKGGLRHGSGQKRGVFTAAHTCTGHICECPPPPPASQSWRAGKTDTATSWQGGGGAQSFLVH